MVLAPVAKHEAHHQVRGQGARIHQHRDQVRSPLQDAPIAPVPGRSGGCFSHFSCPSNGGADGVGQSFQLAAGTEGQDLTW